MLQLTALGAPHHISLASHSGLIAQPANRPSSRKGVECSAWNMSSELRVPWFKLELFHFTAGLLGRFQFLSSGDDDKSTCDIRLLGGLC